VTTANGLQKINFDGKVLSAGYRPGIYSSPRRLLRDQGKLFTFYDVEDCRLDPRLRFGMSVLCAPIAGVDWKITVNDASWESSNPDPDSINDTPEELQFIHKMWKRMWQHDLHKILSSLEYGVAGGEVVYRFSDADQRWEFDALEDRHPRDIIPLVDGQKKLCALDIRNVPKQQGGLTRLPSPRWWWVNHRARFGSLYGSSRYIAAWERYQEKTAQKGAVDIRRTFYFKHAFTGPVMRYPNGMIEDSPGHFRTCQEYSREICEKYEAGGTMQLPAARDEKGEYIWGWEWPKVGESLRDMRDYLKDLDAEMFEGLEIPQEVVKASETGSGWSGRSIPLLVFLASLDPIVAHDFQCLERQMLWHLVRVNYGPLRYEIEPISLVPKGEDPNKKGGEGPPKPGGENPAPGPGQPPQPAGPQPQAGGQPVQLSAVHAPPGGVTVQGTHYPGGQWIPGEVMAKATGAEKAKIEGKSEEKPPGKTPDAKGAFSALKSAGASGLQAMAKLGGTIGHWEHVAKEWAAVTASSNVAKLPVALQAVVKGAWGVIRLANAAAFLSFTAGQAFAEKVATERGATPEAAAKLRAVLSTIDITILKPSFFAGEMIAGPAVGAAASFVPIGSLTYLAYATATNPLATARAAKGAVQAAAGKIKAAGGYVRKKVGLSEASPAADEFASDLLAFIGDDDYRLALYLHAQDETEDCQEALELAEEAAKAAA
jgi:hypothetical protein